MTMTYKQTPKVHKTLRKVVLIHKHSSKNKQTKIRFRKLNFQLITIPENNMFLSAI